MVLRMSLSHLERKSISQESCEKRESGVLGNPLDHVRHSLTLPFPQLRQKAQHQKERSACLVGGGGSRKNYLDHLYRAQQQEYEIWALDGAYAWLVDCGITPDVHVMCSPCQDNAVYVPKTTEAILFYASQCHPEVFLRASASSPHVVIWHPQIEGIEGIDDLKDCLHIEGGSRVGMCGLTLAFMTGVHALHLFGYDSSFDDQAVVTSEEKHLYVQVDDQRFISTQPLAEQITEFQRLLKILIPQGARISMHGQGLLPYVMKKIMV